MNNQPDDTINKVLAALRDAAPSEGMDSRIAARLEQAQYSQYAQTQPAPYWRALTGQSLAAAWGRGALTGAAVALLTVAAVLLLQHATRRVSPITQAANATLIRGATPLTVGTADSPCGQPAILRMHPSSMPATQIASSPLAPTGHAHPTPTGPLTAQERDLLRFAHIAGTTVANQENEARLEAANAAQFENFFTPPPPPPQPEPAQPEASSEPTATPPANPEPAPKLANPQAETAPDVTR
jgi:hypothetical protein